ncbi:MAG: metallophosphoesterase, partial [Candidatus Hydrogenedentes bacterium]|nr:metallophosphoesterase [Candidatus Hydrogenedentota bacterium]
MLFFRKSFILLVIGAIAPLCIYAESASLLILHTNDMHDHIKKGSDGLGGVPYVAGYIASIRAQRDDIILLDGGDVMHKGDMVAYMTKSHIMYEAMRKIKYTAGVPGNHDLDGGIEQLSECAALADHPLLCLNYFDENGNLPFPPSSVVEVNGIRVGILGMTNIRSTIEKEGARLAIEAKRLDDDVDLLILVAHIGSRNCTALSKLVPEIDIFVGAHTHEAISTPQVVPDTQALIIEAGQYAQYVGWLEITMDMKSKKIEK